MSLAAAYMFGRKQGLVIPLNNFITYYKFDGNANDSVGTNNGTSTNVTFTSGLIGNAANFNGSNSTVIVPDANSLSFGNGTNDVDFSSITLININNVANFPIVFTKLNAANTLQEYTFIISNSKFRGILVSTIGQNARLIDNNTILTNGNWVVLTSTYKASTKTLKMYVDNNVINTDGSVGTYTAMTNTVADLHIGYDPRAQRTLNGQINALSLLNVELTPEQVAYAVTRYKTDNQHLI